jgi:hypothetical protein
MTYCHTCKTGLGAEEELDEDGQPVYTSEPLPAPEIRATPVDMKDPRVTQGVRNMINPALKVGWHVKRLTYSRGPRVGSKGQALSISDSISLILRSGDNQHQVCAVWVDGKSAFAYTQTTRQSPVKTGSKAAIAFIKENPTP